MSGKLQKLVLALFISGVCLCGCSPRVEDVEFTEHTDRYRNNLWVTVNTKKGLFKGRESFLKFKRYHYSFSMKTKEKEYSEKDMEVTIYSENETTIVPERGKVTISKKEPNHIFVNIEISDTRIPKYINGRYRLSLADSDSNYRWYKMR